MPDGMVIDLWISNWINQLKVCQSRRPPANFCVVMEDVDEGRFVREGQKSADSRLISGLPCDIAVRGKQLSA